MIESVVVTGGCGFLGRHIVSAILKQEPQCKVYVLDVKLIKDHPNVAYLTCDIADRSAVDTAFESMNPSPRVVIHVASPTPLKKNDILYQKVNVDGTRHMLKAALASGVHAFVITSSSSVIHDNISDLVDGDETWPVLKQPIQKSPYTLTKAISEEETISANRSQNCNGQSMLTAAVRPCNIFGENDPGLTTKVINVCEAGRAKFRMGKGTNHYSFTHVANVVEGHLLTVNHLLDEYGKDPLPENQRVEGQPFQITSDESIPFWEFTTRISAALGKPISEDQIISIPKPVGLTMGFLAEWLTWALTFGTKESNLSVGGVRYAYMNRTLKCEKAKRVLGYRPLVTIQEGIDRSVKSWKEGKKDV